LLKQAQEMQGRIAKIQEELGQKTVEGSAGGGMVQVTVNGQFNLITVKIEPSVINPTEKEMLEDLIAAAVNDAMRKAREMVSTEMSKITGGFKIPGLMPRSSRWHRKFQRGGAVSEIKSEERREFTGYEYEDCNMKSEICHSERSEDAP
jgi:hypothetical protein